MMLVRLWLLLVLSCNLTLQTNANMEGCLFGDSLQTVDKTLLVSTPEAFFLFWVQKVCT